MPFLANTSVCRKTDFLLIRAFTLSLALPTTFCRVFPPFLKRLIGTNFGFLEPKAGFRTFYKIPDGPGVIGRCVPIYRNLDQKCSKTSEINVFGTHFYTI